MIPLPFLPYFEGALHAYPNVPPSILYGVITQESQWNPRAVNPSGAAGLGGLVPNTARGLGVTDVYNPEQSIFGAARYLSELLNQFGGSVIHAVAAYNTGPGNLQEQGLAGVLSPTWAKGETSRYVAAVNGYAQSYDGSTVLGGQTNPNPTLPSVTASSNPILGCLPGGAVATMILLGSWVCAVCR